METDEKSGLDSFIETCTWLFMNFDRWFPWPFAVVAFVTLPSVLAVMVPVLIVAGWWWLLLAGPGRSFRGWFVNLRDNEYLCDRIDQALESSGVAVQMVTLGDKTAAGQVVEVRTQLGTPDDAVYTRASVVAAALSAWRVVPLQGAKHGRPRLLIQREDPLAQPVGGSWAVAEQPAWDLRDRVPVGVSETGEEATVGLWSQTMLVGGSPGAGKSVFGWLPLIAAAKDPHTILVVVDLKPHGIETAPLGNRADYAAHDTAAARAIFERVWLLIGQRNAVLRSRNLAHVPKEELSPEEFPPVLIVVDEAAELRWDEDGKKALETLQRIVAVGRASGISVMLLTQKPDGETIPTNLRDLFAQRVCFRVGNRAQAETVLGTIPDNARPWEISADTPGVGYMKPLGGDPVRFRSYFINREDITTLCYQAARERGNLMHRKPDGIYELPPLPLSAVPGPPAPKKRRRS